MLWRKNDLFQRDILYERKWVRAEPIPDGNVIMLETSIAYNVTVYVPFFRDPISLLEYIIINEDLEILRKISKRFLFSFLRAYYRILSHR